MIVSKNAVTNSILSAYKAGVVAGRAYGNHHGGAALVRSVFFAGVASKEHSKAHLAAIREAFDMGELDSKSERFQTLIGDDIVELVKQEDLNVQALAREAHAEDSIRMRLRRKVKRTSNA